MENRILSFKPLIAFVVICIFGIGITFAANAVLYMLGVGFIHYATGIPFLILLWLIKVSIKMCELLTVWTSGVDKPNQSKKTENPEL